MPKNKSAFGRIETIIEAYGLDISVSRNGAGLMVLMQTSDDPAGPVMLERARDIAEHFGYIKVAEFENSRGIFLQK